jgi:hypothetical protein
MTNPSHTKDFKEAAEKHIQKYAGEITGSVFTIARSDIYNLREESFMEGCETGYAEAMKEQWEFYLVVREYIRLKDLLPTLKFETQKTNDAAYNQFISIDKRLRKHLSSFTEQEQSNTKDNG